MYTEEEYKNYYLKNKFFPDNQYSNREKILNEKQIYRKYEKYCSRLEKKKEKEPSDYMKRIYEVEEECKKENPNGEYFWSRLTVEQLTVVRNEMRKIKDFSIYDPCHIISRGSSSKLADYKPNILVAPRAFHYYIDLMLDPFSVNPY